MNALNILSLSLFIIFYAAYLLKLYLLSRHSQVKAFVLGKGKKENKIKFVEVSVKLATFLWAIVWLAEGFFGGFISQVFVEFFSTPFTVTGVVLTAAGVGIFITAMVFMKNSWRVGIDKQTKSSLITDGIYKYSRNPAFVGFDLMFAGLFFTYPNLLTLCVMLLNMAALHLLILQEEKHLVSLFGDAYLKYREGTPRYLWFL